MAQNPRPNRKAAAMLELASVRKNHGPPPIVSDCEPYWLSESNEDPDPLSSSIESGKGRIGVVLIADVGVIMVPMDRLEYRHKSSP